MCRLVREIYFISFCNYVLPFHYLCFECQKISKKSFICNLSQKWTKNCPCQYFRVNLGENFEVISGKGQLISDWITDVMAGVPWRKYGDLQRLIDWFWLFNRPVDDRSCQPRKCRPLAFSSSEDVSFSHFKTNENMNWPVTNRIVNYTWIYSDKSPSNIQVIWSDSLVIVVAVNLKVGISDVFVMIVSRIIIISS
jgi:hypothetical protein